MQWMPVSVRRAEQHKKTSRYSQMTRKYIIEIEEIPFEQQQPEVFANEGRIAGPRASKKLFRAVGIPSLFFTEDDLKKLTLAE